MCVLFANFVLLHSFLRVGLGYCFPIYLPKFFLRSFQRSFENCAPFLNIFFGRFFKFFQRHFPKKFRKFGPRLFNCFLLVCVCLCVYMMTHHHLLMSYTTALLWKLLHFTVVMFKSLHLAEICTQDTNAFLVKCPVLLSFIIW